MAQRTFSIVKPDAVRKGYTGAILAEIEKAGFKIVSIKKQSISKPQAEGFYYVHKERPFFAESGFACFGTATAHGDFWSSTAMKIRPAMSLSITCKAVWGRASLTS